LRRLSPCVHSVKSCQAWARENAGEADAKKSLSDMENIFSLLLNLVRASSVFSEYYGEILGITLFCSQVST
jgi:hypothetical protein